MTLHYCCELLSNIRQVSICISQPDDTPFQAQAITIHPSRRALTLTSINTSSSSQTHIFLPATVQAASPSLPITKGFSYRLPLTSSFTLSDRENNVHWSAPELDQFTTFMCRQCTTVIIPPNTINVWKDLPSANWADLMDFWHCHKPVEPSDAGVGAKYSKLGNAVAQRGTGLVEMMYFLVDKEDIVNIIEPGPDSLTITCTSCHNPLGLYDEKARGCRLFKWSLAHSTQTPSTITTQTDDNLSISTPKPLLYNDKQTYTSSTHAISSWLIAHLLALADSQGQRRFYIKVGEALIRQSDGDAVKEDTEGKDKHINSTHQHVNIQSTLQILIWLFNPYTIITTHTNPRPTHVAKMYYQLLNTDVTISNGQPALSVHNIRPTEQGEGMGINDFDSVYVPENVFKDFEKTLRESNQDLPEKLQTLNLGGGVAGGVGTVVGEWRTGYIERF